MPRCARQPRGSPPFLFPKRLSIPWPTGETRTEIGECPRGRAGIPLEESMPNALITGFTGQDGSYLAELLLQKGYTVYGLVRRTSVLADERVRHLLNDVEIVDADLLDQHSLVQALRQAKPDEVY